MIFTMSSWRLISFWIKQARLQDKGNFVFFRDHK
jgi:hypothetical protein